MRLKCAYLFLSPKRPVRRHFPSHRPLYDVEKLVRRRNSSLPVVRGPRYALPNAEPLFAAVASTAGRTTSGDRRSRAAADFDTSLIHRFAVAPPARPRNANFLLATIGVPAPRTVLAAKFLHLRFSRVRRYRFCFKGFSPPATVRSVRPREVYRKIKIKSTRVKTGFPRARQYFDTTSALAFLLEKRVFHELNAFLTVYSVPRRASRSPRVGIRPVRNVRDGKCK